MNSGSLLDGIELNERGVEPQICTAVDAETVNREFWCKLKTGSRDSYLRRNREVGLPVSQQER